MAINLKAWKSVDGEVVYIQEGQSGETLLGANYTRIAGLDRVVSNDFSTFEDFENSSQLNARDTANRNRSNHTGTQLASTIDNFDSAVANTPIVTANTAKVSADGSVGTHSDVDLSGIASGDLLKWDGSQFISSTTTNAFSVFPIWAEENGGIANGQAEWSFGNGATGATVGIVIPVNCELFACSINAEVFGTSASIDFGKNGVNFWTNTFFGADGFNFIGPIPYAPGDRLSFRTNTVNGTASDVRICAWFRVPAQADGSKTDIKAVTNSNVAYSSTTFATIPGMSSTITLTKTGNLFGDLIYSAARSGATNAATQFRVVINGTNGNTFSDTLSTFNDTGSASHFVENVPAGTYTIEAQCATTQPITIAAAKLRLTAREQ